MTTKHILYVALSFLMVALVSCNKVPIGYLDTRQAIFTPDTIYVSRTINPDSPRAKNGAPWTSLRIQGVAGTNPHQLRLPLRKGQQWRRCSKI